MFDVGLQYMSSEYESVKLAVRALAKKVEQMPIYDFSPDSTMKSTRATGYNENEEIEANSNLGRTIILENVLSGQNIGNALW